MSDLHIGAAHADYKKIDEEIHQAEENSDRVLLNGDVFDMILPKDHKRYDPGCIHPRLANHPTPVNKAIEWGVEILAPVAHLIDMVGVGNHETAVMKWHSVDPTLLLVYELEKIAQKKVPNHIIHYGGYTGFVDYRLRVRGKDSKRETQGGGVRWVLYYHHGSGGSAPVTKGMIDFNRKDTWVDADAIWMGHKHNRLMDAVEKVRCPKEGDDVQVNEVRHIMTGAYFRTYVGQSQKSVREHGRRSNYAADWGMAPQMKGGARVVLKVLRTYQLDVKITQ